MSRQSGIHPEIGSLIRHKDEMWAQLRDNNFSGALETMLLILYDIKKEDVNQTIIDSVNQEISLLEAFENQNQRKKRLIQQRKTYWGWARNIVQILWDKQYLLSQKYGPIVGKDAVHLG